MVPGRISDGPAPNEYKAIRLVFISAPTHLRTRVSLSVAASCHWTTPGFFLKAVVEVGFYAGGLAFDAFFDGEDLVELGHGFALVSRPEFWGIRFGL